LLVVLTLVATAPQWAPLLPWGPVADQATERVLAARLDRLEAAAAKVQLQPQQLQEQIGQQLRQPLEQIRQQLQQSTAEAKTSSQQIGKRIEALEARPASPVGDFAEIRQQVTKLSQTTAELTARLDALEKAGHARSARETVEAALVLAVLQIRGAVQTGRPFAAEYDAFAALARSDPEIGEAAAPLAEPAKNGVASPAVLAKRLRELAADIASTSSPAPRSAAPGWADAVLARLRGLVTIRRIDGARPEGAAAAVNAAELALAGGDLAGAVAALDKLTGGPAEIVAAWLRMAHQRLAVDAALRRVEALLTARLGSTPATPGSSG
jgi:hypothetical protein